MAARSSPAHPSKSAAGIVRDIVARTCGRKAVADHQYLGRDLYISSAEKAELLVAIEVAFGIDFTVGEAERVFTVRHLIIAVTRKIWSVKSSVGDHLQLSEAIRNLVAGAADARQAIDLNVAATAIADDYPLSGLTIDEVRDEIERAATGAGVVLLKREKHIRGQGQM